MPEVSNCCCCIGLRTGTITFGILSCIGSLLLMIMSAVGLVKVYGSVDSAYMTPEMASVVTQLIVMIIIGVIGAIASFLLTRGAVKKNIRILMAWKVLLIVGIVLAWILVVVASFNDFEDKAILIGENTGYAVVAAYIILVVHSYRQELLREATERQQSKLQQGD